MRIRTFVIVTSLTLCGLSVAGVALQSRQLQGLREEGQRLRQQLRDLESDKANPATASAEAPAVSSPSTELLQLRNHVSQLARRERERAGTQLENERLRTQIASARTNAVAQLPASYIRKSEARNLGYATPVATLETFFWAARNRNLSILLACYTPEAAAKVQRGIERYGEGTVEWAERLVAVPGINVVELVQEREDVILLKAEVAPRSGILGPPFEFHRINGEWKMDFGPGAGL